MINYKQPLKLVFIGWSIDSAIGYTHFIASQMDHLFILSAGCFSRNEQINKETALTWGVKDNVDIAQKLNQYKIENNYNIKWPYDAKQATKNLEVFEAIQKSSDEKKWIDIN